MNVHQRLNERILIIEIDNPPVNAMATSVRQQLLVAFQQADSNPDIDAIVLTGAGKAFCGGADISEFGLTPREPALPDLINAIEAVKKPVVAAIQGSAYGGGFEIALGSHFRVGLKNARLALPEVKLGLLPGAGGTQRLPRLIGLKRAAQIIVSGEPINATEALELGILDAVYESELLDNAIAFARKAIINAAPLRRVSEMNERIAGEWAYVRTFEDEASALLKRARGLEAPAACLASIRNVLTQPFHDGLKQERASFMRLRDGTQSKAQRHLFFAERAALKLRGVDLDTKPRNVRNVVVLGAGTMGGGIAMSFASAGFHVTMIDPNGEAMTRGMGIVKANYAAMVKRGSISTEAMDNALLHLQGDSTFDAVGEADLVIEAVFEDMALKQKIFADLDARAKPGAILASNTSTLDINVIAAATKRPQDVLGMHFFSPANVMRLLEIVRGEHTAPDVLATAIAVGKATGKVPVTVGVCYGFVGNRMLHARGEQVEMLLLEGASPSAIDAVATSFGFAMGPCAVSDLAGLDVGWRIRKERGTTAAVADAICELGRFGQKTGKGYYLYEAGNRTPIPDPAIDALIARVSAERGIARRVIDPKEIEERLIYPLINEGARILDEGIAERAGDIDLIWIHGYGFPIGRGGPMHYADQVGLKEIAARLTRHAGTTGSARMQPAPLLLKCAAAGMGFADHATKAKG